MSQERCAQTCQTRAATSARCPTPSSWSPATSACASRRARAVPWQASPSPRQAEARGHGSRPTVRGSTAARAATSTKAARPLPSTFAMAALFGHIAPASSTPARSRWPTTGCSSSMPGPARQRSNRCAARPSATPSPPACPRSRCRGSPTTLEAPRRQTYARWSLLMPAPARPFGERPWTLAPWARAPASCATKASSWCSPTWTARALPRSRPTMAR